MFLIVLAYAILASAFTVAKTVLFYAKPFFVIGIRMTLAGTILLSFQYLVRRKRIIPKSEDISLFFKVSLFHVYFAFLLEFWALQKMDSSKVTLIYSITPFIAVALSYFLLSERLSRKKFGGMLLGFIGLLPILVLQHNPYEGGEFLKISSREIVLLLAVISAAYAWFDVKRLIQRNYTLVMINGVAMFVGGVLALVTSGIIEGFSPSPIFEFWPFIGWLLLLIFLSNVVFYNLFGWLLKRYTITFLTFAGFLSPTFGAFYGWLFLGEVITWHYFLSLSVIAIAFYLFYCEEIKTQR